MMNMNFRINGSVKHVILYALLDERHHVNAKTIIEGLTEISELEDYFDSAFL